MSFVHAPFSTTHPVPGHDGDLLPLPCPPARLMDPEAGCQTSEPAPGSRRCACPDAQATSTGSFHHEVVAIVVMEQARLHPPQSCLVNTV